ncbi:flagellar hook-length control protein FliK [Paraglaciecola sp. L3A3]|uniref:flagellar hook-length control protein FliK n=1 Tax=Paraglaciecola sp. L3A3 TaxID=2686358 RepID=UPI00131B7C54|nr:flagellar hook-length control protein FliK [Paraglaciecola sp. L3A3]
MPTTPPSTNSILPQTLSELNKLTSSSDLAKQGVEVIVKQLSGNLLNLTATTSLLSKPALIPNPVINGNLTNGQSHQIKINATNSPVLEFFSNESPIDKKLIELTRQQLETLLKLPAKQLMAQLSQVTSSPSNKTVVLNATVLDAEPSANKTDKLTLSQNMAASPKSNPIPNGPPILRLQLNEGKPMAEIQLNLKQQQQFSIGDKVALTVTAKGVNWQVSVQNSGTATPQAAFNEKILEQNQLTSTKPLQQGSQLQTANNTQTLLLSPKQAINLTKAVAQELFANKATNTEWPLPIKQVIQHLNKSQNVLAQSLSQTLQTLPIDKLILQQDPQSKFQLIVESKQPVAWLPITKEIAQALAPLKLPNQQSVEKILNQSITAEPPSSVSNKHILPESSLIESVTKPLTQILNQLGDSAKKIWFAQKEQPQVSNNPLPNKIPDNTKLPQGAISPERTAELATQLNKNTNEQIVKNTATQLPIHSKLENAINLKVLASQLEQQVTHEPKETSLITSKLLTSKSLQIGLIQQLLRVVQAKAEVPSISLQNIEKALTDAELVKQTPEQTNKQIIEQVLQQTKSALPQGKELDASNIKQLLTTPALNLTPTQLVSASTNQGFMSGLITVLQMSLSARLTRHQTSREEQVARVLSTILPASGQSKPSITAKGLNEFLQLEQKHQLIREIGRLFSAHQANKFHNAEQLLQGQETFYYNLPTLLNGAFKDIELLIKREENSKEQNEKGESVNKTWQLTMKLGIGELGELLTKAKLRPDNLEVNFYASNEAVKIQVMNYLPLLKRKLETLGIEVSKSQCQLGKIPESLQERPYHVFQTKV